MSEPTNNNGGLLLPVCIPETEITHLFSALDLYRVLRNGGLSYPAFDAVAAAVGFIDNPQESPCLDGIASGGTCWTIDTTSSAMQFFYNDPFTPIEEQTVPRLGQWTRWQAERDNVSGWIERMAEIAEDYTAFDADIGYYPNDCFVRQPDNVYDWGDPSQFLNSLDAIRKLEFPYVRIECTGAGQLELELLKLPFGGSAIILYDFELSISDILWQIVQGNFDPLQNVIQTELERELLTFPPEANETNVIEINFEEDTEHVVDVYFVPRFDFSALDFLGQGGGIRSVSMCQNLTLKSPDGEEIRRTNHQLSAFKRSNFIMATKDEICEAILCASEKIAQRILFSSDTGNIRNGISIDKDTGEISLRNTSSNLNNQAPENATANEIVYGQAMAVGRGFRDMVGELVAWDGNAITVQEIVNRLRQFYTFIRPVEGAAVDALLDGLNSTLADATDQTTPTVSPVNIANLVFCNGANKQSLYRYALQVEESGGTDVVHIAAFYRTLIDELEDEQILAWYESGISTPDTNYVSAPCYRIDPFTLKFTGEMASSNTQVVNNGTPVAKTDNKWRVEITGVLTASNGDTYNGIHKKTAGGVVSQPTARMDWSNGVQSFPTVSYSENGYAFTFERAGLASLDGIQAMLTSGSVFDPFRVAGTTGTITYTIIDLGGI